MPEPVADVADVAVVGAGPTGLLLAIELCLGGVRPVMLERLPGISPIPKGNGLIGQIVTMLDYRGLLGPLRTGATYCGPVPAFFFGPLNLELSRLGASPLQILAIPQRRLEERLQQRLIELGGGVQRGHELVGLAQDDEAVTAELRGPDGRYRLRARYLVGCDGAHSLVRELAGIGFPGVTSSEIVRIGRVMLPDAMIEPGSRALRVPGVGVLQPAQLVPTPAGSYSLAPLASLDAEAPPQAYIIATREQRPDADSGQAPEAPLTLAELRASVRRVIGADLPMTDPQWLSRIVGNSRQADRYQAGRILLAGDAAHVFGIGGGLNVGMLDSVNLGWKLAAAVAGWAPAGLLDSYHAERYPAGRRYLMQGRVQKALSQQDESGEALRELFGELLADRAALRHVAELIAGSDVRYEVTGRPPHPLAGRLAPDVRLTTAEGPTRVGDLLRAARPVLLDGTAGDRVSRAAEGWAERVPALKIEPGTWSPAADAVLIRPDGCVAWAAGPDAADPAAGLQDALRTWCGAEA